MGSSSSNDARPRGKRKVEQEREDENYKRIRPYSMSVGPMFRYEHETSYRATNSQMIKTTSSKRELLGKIIKSIDEGAVFSDQCDVILSDYIHPESPKLITVSLSSMDDENTLTSDMGSVMVPLYLNLTNDQWEDIKSQIGIDEGHGAWSVELNRGRPMSSKSMLTTGTVSLESFVNEVVGRFSRYNVGNTTTWDKNSSKFGFILVLQYMHALTCTVEFFQPIEFKIRIGPQFKYAYSSTEGIRRGAGEISDSRTTSGIDVFREDAAGVDTTLPNELIIYPGQEKQFDAVQNADRLVDHAHMLKQQNNQKPIPPMITRIINQDDQYGKRDEYLKAAGEDGSTQAAVPEHSFQLTTHMALGPSFRSAISQAISYLDRSVPETKKMFEETYLGIPQARSHLATIIEAELKENEVSISRYQDPQALKAMKKRKLFAAYSLKKMLLV